MNIKIYREHGALNSKPIFDVIERGLIRLGHNIVEANEDMPVIWSVLWAGRMKSNRQVYHDAIRQGKPVMIVEVGTLKRNQLWRVSLNHINALGIFPNLPFDKSRPEKIGVVLGNQLKRTNDKILIALQHDKSLQWEKQPSMKKWVSDSVNKIKMFTDRDIVIRPHPRQLFHTNQFQIEKPMRLKDSYDNFDFTNNYHCIVNYCSGPGIIGAINGTPVIVSKDSLAYPVSQQFENIEERKFRIPDRTDWLIDMCHKEWTVAELADGFPLEGLLLDF